MLTTTCFSYENIQKSHFGKFSVLMCSLIGFSNFQQPPIGKKKLIPKLKERTALLVPGKKREKANHLATQKQKNTKF